MTRPTPPQRLPSSRQSPSLPRRSRDLDAKQPWVGPGTGSVPDRAAPPAAAPSSSSPTPPPSRRCDDHLNPPSTRRGRSVDASGPRACSGRWARSVIASTTASPRASSAHCSSSCSTNTAGTPATSSPTRSSTGSNAGTTPNDDTATAECSAPSTTRPQPRHDYHNPPVRCNGGSSQSFEARGNRASLAVVETGIARQIARSTQCGSPVPYGGAAPGATEAGSQPTFVQWPHPVDQNPTSVAWIVTVKPPTQPLSPSMVV